MAINRKKINRKFVKEIVEPGGNKNNSFWFIFQDNNLLVYSINKNQYSIPLVKNLKVLKITPIRTQFLGKYGNTFCYSVEVSKNIESPQNMVFHNLRRLYGLIDYDLFKIAGYAYQIMKWDQTFQFCGRCGSKTSNLKNERAKICMKCKLINYPKISPAIIVAVIKENTILMARAKRFKKGLYSVLAGFVEPGETLEECIRREVKEEVNIEIENIRYFGSQSWTFTDSLMVGFIAEYENGELSIDKNELEEAKWFTPDRLPEFPDQLSIAWKLIDWFREKYAKR